jgi:2-polyprenyl-3-methyl-5-hydroxy-6-metoxy-1,4-benzoquinol methylase
MIPGMDEGEAREREAILARLARRTSATGMFAAPCLPILFEHYWEKVVKLFEAIERPLSGVQLTQFRGALRQIVDRGFQASPYAQFILNYSPAGEDGSEIQCDFSLAMPTLEQEYERWLKNDAAPNELFGTHPDAKVIDLATRLKASAEAGASSPVRVLDVGAGGGRNALALAQLGLEVDALEPVAGLANALTGEAARRGVAVNVTMGDVLETGTVIAEGRYPLIVLSEVVTHFSRDQLARVLPKLARSLTDDGTLLFNAFVSRDGYRPSRVAVEVAQTVWSTFFSRQELADVAERAGLRLVQEELCLEYEAARQPAGQWPPTPWYPFWARGHNLFDRAAGPAPITLYWLEYRRS